MIYKKMIVILFLSACNLNASYIDSQDDFNLDNSNVENQTVFHDLTDPLEKPEDSIAVKSPTSITALESNPDFSLLEDDSEEELFFDTQEGPFSVSEKLLDFNKNYPEKDRCTGIDKRLDVERLSVRDHIHNWLKYYLSDVSKKDVYQQFVHRYDKIQLKRLQAKIDYDNQPIKITKKQHVQPKDFHQEMDDFDANMEELMNQEFGQDSDDFDTDSRFTMQQQNEQDAYENSYNALVQDELKEQETAAHLYNMRRDRLNKKYNKVPIKKAPSKKINRTFIK